MLAINLCIFTLTGLLLGSHLSSDDVFLQLPLFEKFFLFVIFSIFSYSLKLCLQCLRQPQKLDIGLLIILALSISVRILTIDTHSLWLDEYTQFERSQHSSPAAEAIYQQQMPMSYYFSHLSFKAFGNQEFAVRFFPTLWGVLSCGIFYLFLKSLLQSSIALFCTSILFTLFPWFVRYSSEGRPISLTIFTATILAYALFSKKIAYKIRIYFIFASSYLFLNSIFLQPSFLVLSFIFSALVFYQKKDFIGSKSITVILCSLALCSPNFYYIYQASVAQFIHDTSSMDLPSIELLFHNFGQITRSLLFQAPVFIALLAIYFLNFKNQSRHQSLILINSLTCIAFILSYGFMFTIYVDWSLSPRYTLSVIPFIFLTFALILDSLLSTAAKKQPAFYFSLIGLLYIAVPLQAWELNKSFNSNHYSRSESDWRATHSNISKIAEDGDIIFSFHSRDFGSWSCSYVVAPEFYLTKKLYYPSILTRPNSDQYINSLDKESVAPKRIFFIFLWPINFNLDKLPNDVITFQTKRILLLHSSVHLNWKATFLRIAKHIEDATPNAEKRLLAPMYKQKFAVELLQQDLKAAKRTLLTMIELGIKEKEPDSYNKFKAQLGE